MHKTTPEEVMLGFDFGMKRIGIAIGDTLTNTAKPLTTISAKDGIPQWSQIDALIQEWKINSMVVGMPYRLDGTSQDITRSATKFLNRLKAKFSLPVFFMDERLTTKVAKIELQRHDKKNVSIDSMAATLILQSWLNQRNINSGGITIDSSSC